MTKRNDLLAMVHLGANRLGLDESSYRDWLEKHTGARSCKAIGNADLERLVAMLRELGALDRPTPKPLGGNGQDRPTPDQLRTAEGMLQKIGLTGLNDPGFITFVRRIAHVDNPRFLTRELMTKVLIGLSRWKDQRAEKPARSK